MSIDCVLCTMPIMRSQHISLLAPHLLKGYLNKHEISSEVINLNEKLVKFLNMDVVPSHCPEFVEDDKFKELYKNIKPFIIQEALHIIQKRPKVIGLSLMSNQSQLITEKLCQEIKKLDIKSVIAIGGPGAFGFDKYLYSKKLIDFYVRGDGEKALLEILKGNYNYKGINSDESNIEDLNLLPNSDYSDASNKTTVYIQSSRGCKNNCDFCNTNSLFGKYRYRSGILVAKEMIFNSETYGTKNYLMSDNAINLSTSLPNNLCDELLKYYNDSPPFQWWAHAVLKSNLDFKKIKKCGCACLQVGLESGSQKILNDMNKKLNLDNIDSFIKDCTDSDIILKLYVTSGYPTETEEDFQMTLDLITKLKHEYKDKIFFRTISPIVIYRDTGLYYKSKSMGIELGQESSGWFYNYWIYKNNTYDVRIDRYNRLRFCCGDNI